MYRKNRYVGFSKKNYDTAARAKFFIDDDAIKTDTDGCLSSCIPSMRAEVMQTNPQSGFIVYDFSSTDNVHPVGTPHKGNVVTTAPALPNGISENDLEELAKKCMLKKADIKLTDGDADEKALAAAIKAQIANGKVNATAQMSDSGSSS